MDDRMTDEALERIAAFRAAVVAEGPVYDVDALASFAEIDGVKLLDEVRRLRAIEAAARAYQAASRRKHDLDRTASAFPYERYAADNDWDAARRALWDALEGAP